MPLPGYSAKPRKQGGGAGGAIPQSADRSLLGLICISCEDFGEPFLKPGQTLGRLVCFNAHNDGPCDNQGKEPAGCGPDHAMPLNVFGLGQSEQCLSIVGLRRFHDEHEETLLTVLGVLVGTQATMQ